MKTYHFCVIARRAQFFAPDAAIFKPEAWQPGARHKSTNRQNPEFLIRPAGTPICVIARSAATRQSLTERNGIPERSTGAANRQNAQNFDPSRRDTTSALRGKRHFARASARISHASAYFARSKIVFHCAAILGQRPNFTAQPRRRIALHFPIAPAPSACHTYRAPRRNFLSFVRYSCIPCVAMIY